MLLVRLIDRLFAVYVLLIFVRVILSWVQADPYHPAVRFVHRWTDPVLRPVRNVLPPLGGLDFSPWVVIIVLEWVVRPAVVNLLARIVRPAVAGLLGQILA